MATFAQFLGALLIIFGIGFYLVGKNYGVPSFFNVGTISAIILGVVEFFLAKPIKNGQTWAAIIAIIIPIIFLLIAFGENFF